MYCDIYSCLENCQHIDRPNLVSTASRVWRYVGCLVEVVAADSAVKEGVGEHLKQKHSLLKWDEQHTDTSLTRIHSKYVLILQW